MGNACARKKVLVFKPDGDSVTYKLTTLQCVLRKSTGNDSSLMHGESSVCATLTFKDKGTYEHWFEYETYQKKGSQIITWVDKNDPTKGVQTNGLGTMVRLFPEYEHISGKSINVYPHLDVRVQPLQQQKQ